MPIETIKVKTGLIADEHGRFALEGIILDDGMRSGLQHLVQQRGYSFWGRFIDDAVSHYSDALVRGRLQMERDKREEVTLTTPKTPEEFSRSFQQINDQWYNRLRTFFTGREAITSIFNDPKYSSEHRPLLDRIVLSEQGAQSLKKIRETILITEWAQAVAYAVMFEELVSYYKAKGYSSSSR